MISDWDFYLLSRNLLSINTKYFKTFSIMSKNQTIKKKVNKLLTEVNPTKYYIIYIL